MSNISKSLQRDSNMELLRIVAMSMILCGHFIFHGLKKIVWFESPFTICGVNLFFLISGWFGIRFSVRSIVKLTVTTLFFLLVNLVILAIFKPEFSKELYKVFLTPIEASGLWFIMIYLGLLCFAPVLQAGLEHLSDKKLFIFLIAFSAFNMYSCWYGGNYASVNGYTFVQAVWLYGIAYTCRRKEVYISRVRARYYLWAFLACCVINEVVMMSFNTHNYTYYNAPNVVIPSLALFLYFTQISIKSKAINKIGHVALGCYMLQDSWLGRQIVYPKITELYYTFNAQFSFAGTMGIMCAIFAGLFVLYWLCAYLLMPIADLLSKGCYKALSVIWTKLKTIPTLRKLTGSREFVD